MTLKHTLYLNTYGTSDTFEVAPVFTVTERAVLDRFAATVGDKFAASHDGLFVPGSSVGNMYALILARHRLFPDVATKGMAAAGRLVAFVSQEAHYSYLKSVKALGIGSDNLVTVRTDEHGRMDPEALGEAITATKADGGTPFFVGATSGTTVIGAFDPLRKVSRVCRQHDGVWLHVDAAWGGGALVSPSHRHNLDGADDADSLTCSLHKMLGATMQCSIFVTRHTDALRAANAANAAYLFQPDKLHSECDVGDKSIQCGRKADGFKMWVMWKSLGDQGLARRVDHLFHLASHTATQIKESEGAFVMAYTPSCTNVCFWYVPEALRPLPALCALSAEHPVHAVAPRIKAAMQQAGDAMIGFTSINGRPNFFRWVFASADSVTLDDIDAILQRIAVLGEEQPAAPLPA